MTRSNATLIAAIEEPGRGVKTDEAGGAGDKYAHAVLLASPFCPKSLPKSHRRMPRVNALLCASLVDAF
jgi:hypothetical protein